MRKRIVVELSGGHADVSHYGKTVWLRFQPPSFGEVSAKIVTVEDVPEEEGKPKYDPQMIERLSDASRLAHELAENVALSGYKTPLTCNTPHGDVVITLDRDRKPQPTQLKPCPFCGGEVILEGPVFTSDNTLFVECPKCDTYGPTGSTKEEAAAAWNRRA